MDPNLPNRAYADGYAAGQRNMREQAARVLTEAPHLHDQTPTALWAKQVTAFWAKQVAGLIIALEIKKQP